MGDRIFKAEPGATERPYVALALSGGGARAIAFHLGCLRALHDLGILQQVRVISTVSGGSIIGALYAYGQHSSFEEFDKHVVALLQAGLQWRILRTALFSRELPKIVGTVLVNGSVSLVLVIVRSVLGAVRWTVGWSPRRFLAWLESLDERIPFWGSLTTAFERLLARDLFGGSRLRDVNIEGLEVVINACDLRTGTAFRFGSKTSGAWRYGEVVKGSDIHVAKAVAASAAFPALLPPLVEKFKFAGRGKIREQTVVLTDGGVYDNLGLAVLEPGRSSDFSVNVYNPTHIICLNAGAGQFPVGGRTLWLTSRLIRSFNAVYRKAQDAAYSRLHRNVEVGQLQGFALVYLGQDDSKLPVRPADLIPREAVRDYPTDFARMSQQDIRLLAGRGEQLTRLLISRYLAEL